LQIRKGSILQKMDVNEAKQQVEGMQNAIIIRESLNDFSQKGMGS
jgi:hypothetical protein